MRTLSLQEFTKELFTKDLYFIDYLSYSIGALSFGCFFVLLAIIASGKKVSSIHLKLCSGGLLVFMCWLYVINFTDLLKSEATLKREEAHWKAWYRNVQQCYSCFVSSYFQVVR